MEETIKALREGNHLAYEQLFDSCYKPLCRYAFSILKDMEDAEDIVQKTFCKLWDQRKNLNILTSVSSYLYRIVHNECLNKLHQQINYKQHNRVYFESKEETVDDVSAQIATNELQQAIDNAMLKLPPQCKLVFEMSRMEQLSYSEIAKKLNISTNTIENHISKALKILRVELREFLSVLILFQLLK